MRHDHLDDLAGLARLIRDEGGAREEVEAVLDAVPALVAEVARLRAVEQAARALLGVIPLVGWPEEAILRELLENKARQ